ncbi:MAG: hypothetical protein K0R71_1219 [Bacillales bacterium]|jgi:vacuolar-type H+-ATPase catalytic subunit A/Vma1|nr:hypothetical protein [Bacillales bacterium]
MKITKLIILLLVIGLLTKCTYPSVKNFLIKQKYDDKINHVVDMENSRLRKAGLINLHEKITRSGNNSFVVGIVVFEKGRYIKLHLVLDARESIEVIYAYQNKIKKYKLLLPDSPEFNQLSKYLVGKQDYVENMPRK